MDRESAGNMGLVKRMEVNREQSVYMQILKEGVVDWLLDDSNPSVRYLTLVNILDRKKTDPEVSRAKAQIMVSGVVPKILQKQRGKSWNSPGRFYLDKYRGTVWQLIVLAEHEADATNQGIRDACEYVLCCSQDPDSYGFSYNQRGNNGGGRHSEVIPCLTGNMIWSLIKLGFMHDERTKKGIEWIAKYQRFDDGVEAHLSGWPYDRYEMCWGKHTCHMGVVKSLKALSALSIEQRDSSVRDTISRGADYLLTHHVYKRSHDLSKTAKPGWRKLQFPLMYQTDILEICMILLDLGYRDNRMQDAVDIIASKKGGDGKWNLEATFNGKFQVDVETKGKPSKWITYRALYVLKKYHEMEPNTHEQICY
jgi:hypothetical protein